MGGDKEMKYYFDTDCGVRAFEADGSQDFLITPDMREMTAAEVRAHLAPAIPSRGDVEIKRLRAYADPITGCDRFKAEAYAERLSGNEEAAAIAEQKLLARREQIKAENPWPSEE